jgi:hypothetical protein
LIVSRTALDRSLRRLGRPGIVGVGVLLSCAIFWASAVAPLKARLSRQNAEVAALQAKAVRNTAGGPAQGGIGAFYEFFAGGKSGTDLLQEIFALAARAGIELQRGSYRYNLVSGERIARYEITLPVKGSYVQIRRFLASVLNEIPVASLDRVAFEKKRIGDPNVEAQLRLTLFLDAKGEPPKEPGG